MIESRIGQTGIEREIVILLPFEDYPENGMYYYTGYKTTDIIEDIPEAFYSGFTDSKKSIPRYILNFQNLWDNTSTAGTMKNAQALSCAGKSITHYSSIGEHPYLIIRDLILKLAFSTELDKSINLLEFISVFGVNQYYIDLGEPSQLQNPKNLILFFIGNLIHGLRSLKLNQIPVFNFDLELIQCYADLVLNTNFSKQKYLVKLIKNIRMSNLHIIVRDAMIKSIKEVLLEIEKEEESEFFERLKRSSDFEIRDNQVFYKGKIESLAKCVWENAEILGFEKNPKKIANDLINKYKFVLPKSFCNALYQIRSDKSKAIAPPEAYLDLLQYLLKKIDNQIA